VARLGHCLAIRQVDTGCCNNCELVIHVLPTAANKQISFFWTCR